VTSLVRLGVGTFKKTSEIAGHASHVTFAFTSAKFLPHPGRFFYHYLICNSSTAKRLVPSPGMTQHAGAFLRELDAEVPTFTAFCSLVSHHEDIPLSSLIRAEDLLSSSRR
jgi:hypothetical protein